MKDKLKLIWLMSFGNPWFYALVAMVALPILFFIAIYIVIYAFFAHPEIIGEWFGHLVSGFENIK